MASTIFPKGSDEWMMFQDFYKICQRYWLPEDFNDESYWENGMMKEMDDFFKKYKGKECEDFVRRLALLLPDAMAEKRKRMEKKAG